MISLNFIEAKFFEISSASLFGTPLLISCLLKALTALHLRHLALRKIHENLKTMTVKFQKILKIKNSRDRFKYIHS